MVALERFRALGMARRRECSRYHLQAGHTATDPVTAPVQGVAKDRVAGALHVDADLIGAARLKGDVEQSRERKAAHYREVGDGTPGALHRRIAHSQY